MAEATALRNNALPYPIYGQTYTIAYPFRDADGDLVTAATTPDAEISKNADTFADCTNESTEIATGSGIYYLTLTGTELTTDLAVVQAKSATAGMKTTVAVLQPRKLITLRTGTSASGGVSTSTVVLDASASAIDDFYNGCVAAVDIDGTVQLRMITDYAGSTQTCTVAPDWTTAPDNNDTFTIYDTEFRSFRFADVMGWKGTTAATVHTAGYPVVTVKDGTGTGEIDTTSGGVLVAALANNAITAASIATDAIDADALADNAITAATFAADAITAAKVAADVSAEIADAVWDEATSGHVTAGTFGQALYVIRANTAQSGSASTIQLDGSASASNDIYNNSVVILTAGTGAFQARTITDYVGATKTATISPNWDTNPDATSVFMIIPMFPEVAGAGVPTAAEIADAVWDEDATGHQTGGTFGQAIGDPGADTNTIFKAVVTDATGATVGVDVAAVLADTGTDGVVVASINNNAITAAAIATGAIDADAIADNAIDAGAIAANAITAAKIADGAIDAATFAAGAITATVIATDAIDADAIAADAVTEIQNGLATAAALDTVDNFLDTEIAAIKAKTDSLTFTVANQVDANIQYVNDVQVSGTGAPGDEWGP